MPLTYKTATASVIVFWHVSPLHVEWDEKNTPPSPSKVYTEIITHFPRCDLFISFSFLLRWEKFGKAAVIIGFSNKRDILKMDCQIWRSELERNKSKHFSGSWSILKYPTSFDFSNSGLTKGNCRKGGPIRTIFNSVCPWLRNFTRISRKSWPGGWTQECRWQSDGQTNASESSGIVHVSVHGSSSSPSGWCTHRHTNLNMSV